MSHAHKKAVYVVVAAAAILVMLAGVCWYTKNGSGYMTAYYPEAQNTAGTLTDTKTTTTKTTASAPVPAATLSYNDALKKYEGRRIQFGTDVYGSCLVSPYQNAFKKGMAIMLDNRTAASLKISLDGQAHTLKAYGYKIVTLTATKALPYTISIDCGSGQNNGSILLQQ